MADTSLPLSLSLPLSCPLATFVSAPLTRYLYSERAHLKTHPPAPQIEYIVVSYDDENKNARLSLRQTEILQDLQADADERRRTPSREESPATGNAEPAQNGVGNGVQVGAELVEDGTTAQKSNELRSRFLGAYRTRRSADADSATLCVSVISAAVISANSACIPVFHPEYGRYMLESTPGAPYGATLDDLLLVEGNMRFRCGCLFLLGPSHRHTGCCTFLS